MKVALGIPVLGMLHPACAYTHIGLGAEIALSGCDLFIPEAIGYTPYSNARNVIFDKAIAADCDYVMFADADNTIPVGAFPALLRVMQDEPDAVVVTGYYLRRKPPWGTVWIVPGPGDAELESNGQVAELAGCGLGCALVDIRWCQEKLIPPFFYMPQEGTEDYPFCRRVRQRDGRVLGHTGVICGHMPELLPVHPGNSAIYQQLAEQQAKHPLNRVIEMEASYGAA